MLEVEFVEKVVGQRSVVLMRCNGIGVGDRITDNIGNPDDYRFHDVFHFSYAVFLGWSPVVRSLLRCMRKSSPRLDENEDGARAAIIEEAVSALVFARAKGMRYFENSVQVDYDLLKGIAELIRGYEVEAVPLWQWEQAILEGYRVFRQLRDAHGGRVAWNLPDRTIAFLNR